MIDVANPAEAEVFRWSLNRNALLFAGGVWVAEFLQAMFRQASNGTFRGLDSINERGGSDLLAFALTCGIWLLLRSTPGMTAWGFVRRALALVLLASVIHTVLVWTIFYLVNGPSELVGLNWIRAAPAPLSYLWIYATWVCIVATLVGAEQIRQQQRALADVATRMKDAQLRALRYQLQPHFIFNSLNAISAHLTTGQYAAGRRMLDLLATFLRDTLTSDPRALVTLESELRTQSLYLDIEKIRFEDRLTVEISADLSVRQALVPALILQPLIENAIIHGLAKSVQGARIEIGAKVLDGRLHIWVQDDAATEPDTASSGLGIGLSNIRSRVSAQYGEEATLNGQPLSPGWRSEIVLPFDVETTQPQD